MLEQRFISSHGHQEALQISFKPMEQLGSSQSLLAGYQGNRASWFVDLLDDFKLLLRVQYLRR
jgi:hypothetical protein